MTDYLKRKRRELACFVRGGHRWDVLGGGEGWEVAGCVDCLAYRVGPFDFFNTEVYKPSSYRRGCPICNGEGCSECGHTGERWTSFVEVEGMSARIQGDAPLSPESEKALEAVLRAAYDRLPEDPRS